MIEISNNKKESVDDEQQKSRRFKEELARYYSEHSEHGKDSFKCPIISGRELDLYKLFTEVTNRGGFQVVSDTKQWKDVVSTLDLPSSCTSASFTVRNHYSRYLLSYEQSLYKTSMSRTSSMMMQSSNMNRNMTQNLNQQRPTQMLNQPTQSQEQRYLGKKIMRPDSDLNFFFRNPGKQMMAKEKVYSKKVRILSAIPDMKRIELAFESHLTTEIYWAINTLLIFSSNPSTNICIENQPYLMESMTNYIYYCVNNISDLCFIIDIIEGKTVEEHERLKLGSKGRMSNPISSQGSTTSLYSKDTKRNSMISMHPANTRFRNLNQSNISNGNNSTYGTVNNNTIISNLYKNNFKFLDETNHTVSLPSLAKRNKDLKELDQIKMSTLVDENTTPTNTCITYEEMTEYELSEILISMIQIMRNLSFTPANEGSIFKSAKFMNILYLLFIHSNLNEIVSNSLDIITNLSKHIILKECPYTSLLMTKLFKCLTSPYREMSEQALECFRRLTLPNGNDEYFERMPNEFLCEIVNLLISPKNDIRDSALEILYCLSDQKMETKTRLGKTEKCIQRLVALICSNSNDNRISKFAACVLSKLAEIPIILKLIMPYEQELFVAASTDDSITKVILGIISN